MAIIKAIFGSDQCWNSDNFIAVDDRVRGGSSTSYLNVGFGGRNGTFTGRLDFSTLGGAGFASQLSYFVNGKPSSQPENSDNPQRSDIGIDLSNFEGLYVIILKGDGKTYSLNLKDHVGEVLDYKTSKRVSTIEYKYTFTPKENICQEIPEYGGDAIDFISLTPMFIPFYDFIPYYRGRPVVGETDRDKNIDSETYAPLAVKATPINLRNIRSLSIMCASSFGKQSGCFSLTLESISAYSSF